MKKNKVLIIAFIILLVLPNVVWKCICGYINTETTENRTLVSRPELILKGISCYPNQFEEYYNDHLAFKNIIVNYNAIFNYKVFHIINSEKVLLGKDNWLFYKTAGVDELEDEQPISDYQGINKYTIDEKKSIAKNIQNVDTYLKQQGIDFCMLICPNKEQIYSENLPSSIKKINEKCKAEELVEYLNDNIDVPVLYPVKELMNEKKNYQLYYKYDTHWNELGGFIGEQKIRGLYQNNTEQLSNYNITEMSKDVPKDLAGMLNMNEQFMDDKYYTVSDYKTNVTAQLIDKSDDGMLHAFNSDANDKRTILVVRDSYGEALMGYLSKDFQNVIFIHRSVFNQGYIDLYKPDIIVYEIVERATNDIYDLGDIFGVK